MPPRNRHKDYSENGYYHAYNRGVNKEPIFRDPQDYLVFLTYLKEYLLPKDEKFLFDRLSDPTINYKDRDRILKLLRLKNFSGEITLLAYCLMPNHFHLFIKQKTAQGMNKFMLSLCTRYSMYFNRKYKRVGPIYQDIYKAVGVVTDPQFIYLSKYIHRHNAPHNASASQGPALQGWEAQPSSYDDYLGKRKTEWVHPAEVLAFFRKSTPEADYKAFIQNSELGPIENILLEE